MIVDIKQLFGKAKSPALAAIDDLIRQVDCIQLIRKQRRADGKEKYYRLGMAKSTVSQLVRDTITDTQLDHIFDQEAKTKS